MQRAPANSGSRPCIPQRHNPCCWRPEGGREGGAPPAWAAMPRARGLSFQSNVIHTAKYNVFSFLPLSLYEQFHRVSNLYFLFIIILQVWQGGGCPRAQHPLTLPSPGSPP